MFRTLLDSIDALLRAQKVPLVPVKSPTIDVMSLERRLLYSAVPLLEPPHESITNLAEVGLTEAPNEPLDSDSQGGDGSTLPNCSGDDPARGPLVTGFDASANQLSREIVFIDTGIEDFEQLLADALSRSDSKCDLEIVLLSSDRDGVEHISQVLSKRSGLDAIHIVSHGSAGRVHLGNVELDSQTLPGYAGQVASWSHALNSNADVLFYGCELASGSAGQEFVEQLASLTGADVAASEDLTGQEALGGDWDLEFATGAVNSEFAISMDSQANWQGILATYTVTNTNDGGAGSLRQALLDADNNAGADNIVFNIAGTGVHTINLGSALAVNSQVSINATTESDFAGTPLVVLNGGGTVATGIGVYAGNSTIRGLVIQNFTNSGIDINSSGNWIAGNYIGTSSTGNTAAANWLGINIWDSANNLIGGTTALDRNVISGNSNIGINLNGTGSNLNNTISGNYIGIGANGTSDVGNQWFGIYSNTATNNTIGGTTSGAGNVISGQGTSGTVSYGVYLAASSSGWTIQGNTIGLNAAGTAVVTNQGSGLTVLSANNTIGGTGSFDRNVISGNTTMGINLTGASANNNTILGNYIGTSASGLIDLGNAEDGIQLDTGASGNTIGGLTATSRNIISGNDNAGIAIDNATSSGNSVLGNYIGLGSDGSTSIANTHNGININAAAGTIIGSTNVLGRNVISSNTIHGIGIADASGTEVIGNYIGLDATGTTAKNNLGDGIRVSGLSTGTKIGTATANSGNVIANNTGDGILVSASSATAASILQNSIYSNGEQGIDLGSDDGLTYNDIGDADGAGSANGLLNFPVLKIVASSGGNTTITGKVIGLANTTFRVEFFSNGYGIQDASGYGEARIYIGSVNVTTDASGNGVFSAVLNGVTLGTVETVTATSTQLSSGISIATSEFAGNIRANLKCLMVTGTYSGTGVDNRTFTGLGFRPEALVIMQPGGGTSTPSYIKTSAMAGDSAKNMYTATSLQADFIQSLDGEGFTIGTSLNTSSAVYHWIAFGAGDNIDVGAYAGNGSSQTVAGVGFSPDMLWLANGSTSSMRWESSLSPNTYDFYTGNYSTLNITTLTSDGFSVDSNAAVNQSSQSLYYIAFNQSANYFSLGSYIGNSTSGQNITGVGFEPEFVMTRELNNSNWANVKPESSGYNVDATGNFVGWGPTHAGYISALQSDGFQVSANSEVNGNGLSYGYFAFKQNDAPIIVDTTSDTSDGALTSINALRASRGADGKISLREAIAATNATRNVNGIIDEIDFAISGTGVQTITIGTTALPNITDAVRIDAWTQSGFSSSPLIELDGNDSGTLKDGLKLASGSAGSTIRGFIINRFTGDGIEINSSNNNVIEGNWIGLDETGTVASANALRGIYAINSTGLIIGGSTVASRNVISGNTQQGIYFDNVDISTIQGNYIGTNANGTGDVNGSTANTSQSGFILTNGSSSNQIGGTSASARNLISGNNHYGLEIQTSTSTNNSVQGNYIGTDVTGLTALGNDNGGFSFWGAGIGNTLGGNVTGAGNVIAGNTGINVLVGSASSSATIQGNKIGVGSDGSTILSSTATGGCVAGVSINTLIGTDANGTNDTLERNVISGNLDGVVITDIGTTGTIVAGNFIGTTSLGLAAAANAGDGVRIQAGATSNTIGGSTSTRRNTIAANGGDGVQIDGEATDGNFIQNNYIGLGADGLIVLGNGGDGISITSGADNTTIGGINLGNVIMRSGLRGILVDGASTGTVIYGNYIGINPAGTVVSGQQHSGILIQSGAGWSTIGGTTAGQANTITDSGLGGVYTQGVWIGASAGTGNTIIGNSIYGNAGIGIDLGAAGTTGNDAGDADTGGNNLQNFPVLTTARTNASNQLNLTGTLNSTANSYYRIEFFSNASQHVSGYGEGQTYLGSANVATDASGNAIISTTLNVNVAPGGFISATATSSDASYTTFNDTSEFAQNVTATITPVVTTTGGTLAYTENGNSAVDSGLKVVDTDSSNLTSATVSISSGFISAEDTLDFTNQNGITGIWNSGTGVLTLTGSATVANYQAALRTVAYVNSSDNPNTSTRTVSFQVNDGSGNSNNATRNISVTQVNDAPLLDNTGAMTLTSITEDNTSNSGITVASIISGAGGDRITDVDSGATEGIAITATTNGNGSWEYSTNGGSNWSAVGSVSDSSALLLRSADLIRFVPDGQNGTTGDITFRAWDQTSGSTGTKVDVSVNGGSTAFSTTTEIASITVTSVNDAPVVDNTGFMSLTTITEDDLSNSGNTIAQIVASAGGDRITDVDSGAMEGIALSTVSGANGTWQYNTGTGWTNVGPVSSTNALLLRSTDSLRFLPNGTNSDTGTLLFQAWDQSSGTAGTKVDSSTSGGSTAFSSQVEAAIITVTAVNDEQVVATNIGLTVAENSTGNQINNARLNTTDVDNTSSQLVYTITASTSNGMLRKSGTALGLNSTFTQADLDSGIMTYDHNGSETSSDSFSFSVDDGAGSTSTGVFNLNITPVNDAPVLADTTLSITVAEDAGVPTGAVGSLVSSLVGGVTDVDSGSVKGIAITASVETNGTWYYTTNNGANWKALGTVSSVSSLLLADNGNTRLYFAPASNYYGILTSALTIRGWDQTSGTAGTKVDTSSNGGISAFSSTTDVVDVTVTAVNDAPTAIPDALTAVEAGGTANGTAGTNPTGNVLTNDTDIDASDTKTVSGVAAGVVGSASTNVGSAVVGSFGSIKIDVNGAYTYTVDNTNATVQALRTSANTITDVFTYTIQDADGLTSTTQITVTIQGANDAPFDLATTGLSIAENVANSSTVGKITRSDLDAGDTPSYSLVNNAGGRFAINATTGEITVANGTLLDYEAAISHNITVRITDLSGATYDEVFAINLIDLNEFAVTAPTDVNATANGVDENVTIGTVVGITASASDLDATTNTVTYSLFDNDGGNFAIDANTGVVTTAMAIDRETLGSVRSITVQAASSDGSTATQSFDILINDLDEYDVGPVSDLDGAVNSVAEDATIGTAVGITAVSSDADATTNMITYTLDDSAAGLFSVDANTGVVTVAGVLDYKTSASHNITVRATSTDGSSATRIFTISVINVYGSGVGPISDVDTGFNGVAENSASGTMVGVTAQAKDPDSPDSVSYSLDDDAGGRFAIDSLTGAVMVAGGIDRETAGSYDITIRATSSDGSFSTVTLAIAISDANEFNVGPITDIDLAVDAVDENAAPGTVVGVTALATDNDATNSAISYSLIDDDGGRFSIDSKTGILVVAGGIDREVDGPSRSISVRAISADGSYVDHRLIITINDIDEFDVTLPTDTDNSANFVPENAGIGTTVGINLQAVDNDATTNHVVFHLVDNDGGRFAIDAASGVVTVASNIDRELDGPLRTIVVQATSSDGSFATSIFQINLGAVNDNPPVITSNGGMGTGSIGIFENTIVVTTVVAVDGDLPNQVLSFSIAGGADASKFTINSVTGELRFVDSQDYETPTDANHDNIFEVVIQVDDGQGLSDSQTLSVSIVNVNEAPVAVAESYLGTPSKKLTKISAEGVLANDLDFDGDPIKAVLVSGPSNGTLLLNADGSFEFTPNGAFNGVATFRYFVTDGTLSSSEVDVTLTILPVPPPPANGSGSTDQDQDLDQEDSGDSDSQHELNVTKHNLRGLGLTAIRASANSTQSSSGDRQNSSVSDSPAGENGNTTASGSKRSELVGAVGTIGPDESQIRHALPASALLKRLAIQREQIHTHDSDLSPVQFEYLLESFAKDVALREQSIQFVSGLATAVFIGAATGSAFWLAGGSYLATAMYSSLPVWARFDPIFVLQNNRARKIDDDLTLIEIIKQESVNREEVDERQEAKS